VEPGVRDEPDLGAVVLRLHSADARGRRWSIINVSSTAVRSDCKVDGAVAYVRRSRLQGMTLRWRPILPPRDPRNCLIVGTVATPMVAHLRRSRSRAPRLAVPSKPKHGWDVAWPPSTWRAMSAMVTGVMLRSMAGFWPFAHGRVVDGSNVRNGEFRASGNR